MPAPEADDALPASPVTLEPVHTAKDRAAFMDVADILHRSDPSWIAPLRFEMDERLQASKNPALEGVDHALWVARQEGRLVGRISAQINPRHLERHGDNAAHFGFFAAADAPGVSEALLAAAENWARERGMTRLAGPFNFTINQECGLLVDGFDTPPALMMGHDLPRYERQLTQAGYTPAKDLIAYRFSLTNDAVPPRLQKLVKRLASDPSVQMRSLNVSAYRQEVETIMDIFNDAWSENWGFIPFAPPEIAHMATELRPLVKPDWLSIAEWNGEPVAFALALPNLPEATRDLGGRLLPFGWAKLLYRLKVAGLKSIRMPLMGVRKRLQGSTVGAGLSFAVIDAVYQACRARGVVTSELSWILDNNRNMKRLIEEIGGEPYKTYRLFEKPLGGETSAADAA
ncbi:MAG: GNAT family N-acetyltransferase [Pseudomonadota bacterium]